MAAGLLGLCVHARAARIEASGPRGTLEFDPGDVATIPVLVREARGKSPELKDRLQVPAGWRALSPLGPRFRLKAGGSELRLFSVRIPPTAPAGPHELTYSAQMSDALLPAPIEETQILVVVRARLRLEVTAEAPDRALAGRVYSATFTVRNLGNVSVPFALEFESSRGLTLLPRSLRLDLGAGENVSVAVRASTEDDILEASMHRITALARAGEHSASAVAYTTLIPRSGRAQDPYRRAPFRLSAAHVRLDRTSASQLALTGGGPLDEAGRNSFDLELRQNDSPEAETLGLQELRRASLALGDTALHLGDRGFGLSPLTEQYRFGRGVEVRSAVGRLKGGGYALENRPRTPRDSQTAAFLALDLSPAELRLNALRKRDAAAAELWSAQAALRPSALAEIEAELGFGEVATPSSPARDRAWRASVQGRTDGGSSYSASKIHSGPDYPGFYRDSDLTRGTFRLAFHPRAYLDGSFSRDSFNLRRSTARVTAALEDRMRLGVSYSPATASLVGLVHERQMRRDRLSAPKFDDRGESLSATLNQGLGRFRLQAAAGSYSVENRLGAGRLRRAGYSGRLEYIPLRPYRVGGYVEEGPQVLAADPERELVFGLDASLSSRGKASANLQLERRKGGSSGLETHLGVANLTCELTESTELSLRAQMIEYRRPRRDSSMYLSARLAQAFQIPVARKASLAGVRGRLYDISSGRKSAMPGVLVNVGDAVAYSDEKGRFRFDSLKPGEQFLWAEGGGEARGLITAETTPMRLWLKGGRTLRQDVPMTRPGELVVKLLLFEPASGTAILSERRSSREVVLAGGVAAHPVRLARKDERIERTTDARGVLVVRNLRPGRWKVAPDAEGLPDGTYLERKVVFIDVGPGQSKSVNFRVLPRFRRMIMVP